MGLTDAFHRSSITGIETLTSSLQVSIIAQEKLATQLTAIIQRIPVNGIGSQLLSNPMLLESVRTSPNKGVYSDPGSYPVSASSIKDTSKAMANEEKNSLDSPDLVEQVSKYIQPRCADWCSCACHKYRSIKSPWALKSYVGEVNIRYSGTKPACTERNCRRYSQTSINMTYLLPMYFTHRYLAMAIYFSSQDGPRLSLRIPRVMDWSHLLWNYAKNADLLAIQKLFSEGKASPFDLNPLGSNALIYTIGHSDPRISQFLLKQGADPNLPHEPGRTAGELFWERSFSGQFGTEGISIVGSMLQDTDYVEARSFTILHKIVLGIIYKDLRTELETSTVSINTGDSTNRTPLCWAVIRDDLSAATTLLAFGANPNALDNLGQAPLDFVTSAEVSKLLLAARVNVNARDSKYHRTALHQLCKRAGTVEVVDLLVQAGIDVDVRDADDETPLLNAIFSGLTLAARRLIELGANINAANRSSRDTAIHFAVVFNRHEMISLLLAKGADYTATNLHGRNVAQLAARYSDAKTMAVLAEAELSHLNLSLRDEEGKTASDYMAEREILTDSEVGLHERFEALKKSLYVTDSTKTDSTEITLIDDSAVFDVESQLEEKECHHVPGAFPVPLIELDPGTG